MSIITSIEIENRFAFHPATPENGHGDKHEAIRAICKAFALDLNYLLPDGREKALAITHLEEVMFWANAAVARA